MDWNLNVNLNSILDVEHEFNEYFLKYMILLTRMNIFFEHEWPEFNEYLLKHMILLTRMNIFLNTNNPNNTNIFHMNLWTRMNIYFEHE